MANIRNPEFGVKKDALTLQSQDPNAVMYGITPDSKFIPIKVTDSGEIVLATGIVLSVSDLQIGAVELKNHDTDDRVQINVAHELLAEARLHDDIGTGISSTFVSTKQGLDVNVIGGSALSVSENEDDDIAPNQPSVGLLINLMYGYDGTTRWERIHQTSHRLHVKADLLNTTDNILVYGRTMTGTPANIALPLEIDDGVHPGGLTTVLSSNLLHGFSAGNWSRIGQTSGNLHINVKASVLPAGAATEATLATLSGKIPALGQALMAASMPVAIASNQSDLAVLLKDSAGVGLTSTFNGGKQSLDVNITSSGPTDTDDNSIVPNQVAVLGASLQYGYNGATWERIDSTTNRLHVDGSGVIQPISAAALPLPSGASISALQTSGNLLLSNIDGKLNSLGQKLMTGSVPVVLSSDHSSIGVTVGNFPASQTVDQSNPDLLNLNANIQINDVDVSVSNPVPIQGTIVNAAIGNPNPVAVGGRNIHTGSINILSTDTLFGHEHVHTTTIGQRAEFVTNDVLFGFEDSANLPISATESEAFLIRNPVASGKLIYLGNVSFGINSDKKVEFVVHVGPTITAVGTAIPTASQNIGGTGTSVLLAYSVPTASAFGGSIRRYTSGVDSTSINIDFDFGILIQPGEDVLVTGIPTANNVLMFMSLEWGEM